MTPAEAFGNCLRKFRSARRLSQIDLAATCGLDRTFISLLERGKRQPTLSTVLLLAGALDVKAYDLVFQVERLLAAKRKPSRHRSPLRRL